MKKLNIILLSILFIFGAFSCQDVNEEFDNLDELSAPKNIVNYEFALTESDYSDLKSIALSLAQNASDSSAAKSIESDLALNSTFTSSIVIPELLNDRFYSADEKSSASISYNIDEGEDDTQATYKAAESYELSSDDYISLGGTVASNGYFTLTEKPESYIPTVLASNISSPANGDIQFVSYKYSVEAVNEIFTEGFDSYADEDELEAAGWVRELEKGENETWEVRSYSGNTYMQFSAYGSGEENVAWLISPEIDLSNGAGDFSFDVKVGYYTHDALEVFISDDYNGSNFSEATWTNISDNFTFPTEPTNGYGDFVPAGAMSLGSYSGEVYIAFKYTGDGNNSLTSTFQVDNILIGESVPTNKDYYVYNGSAWAKSDVITIQTSDYDEMGAPGKYDNFSSDVLPQDYIPSYLSAKVAYPQIGDIKYVSYKYYSGGLSTVIGKFEYSGQWDIVSTIVEKTDPFSVGPNGWSLDPTVYLTMAAADYQLIVDYVKETYGDSFVDSYGTADYYYGAGAYYKNFDIRDGKYDSSFASWQEAIREAISKYLPLKYPNASAQVAGIDVIYNITFTTYSGAYGTYTISFQCTKSAPSPEFTYIEDDMPN